MKKGRGNGKGRDKGGPMHLNCVHKAGLLKASLVRAEKQSTHCIRSHTINSTVSITTVKVLYKHELVVCDNKTNENVRNGDNDANC